MDLAHSATVAPVADRAALTHVRALVQQAGTSFFWAMRFLPPHKRDAVFAVYAFCREVDDIADGDMAVQTKRAELDRWRAEIAAIFEATPTRPTARVLAWAAAAFGLARADFEAVVDGMAMDADGPIRAPSLADLDLYCDRVACAVGRLCVPIFGEPGPEGRRVADTLGRALQLTNILRDIAEDAAMGRVYLPADLLAAHTVTFDRPSDLLDHPGLPAVCRDLADRAAAAFVDAERAIAACSKDAMRPAIIMMMVYRRILDRLEADDWTHAGRGTPPGRLEALRGKAEKLLIAVRYGLF